MSRLVLSDTLGDESLATCQVRKTAAIPQGVSVSWPSGGERSLVVVQGAISLCISLTDQEAAAIAELLLEPEDQS